MGRIWRVGAVGLVGLVLAACGSGSASARGDPTLKQWASHNRGAIIGLVKPLGVLISPPTGVDELRGCRQLAKAVAHARRIPLPPTAAARTWRLAVKDLGTFSKACIEHGGDSVAGAKASARSTGTAVGTFIGQLLRAHAPVGTAAMKLLDSAAASASTTTTTTKAPRTTTTTTAAGPKTRFTTGTWAVDTQIAPGIYHTSGGTGCYWARLSNLSGSNTSIIANNIGVGPQIVSISSSDAGFQSKTCGTWTPLTSLASPATSFGDGIWAVGNEIAAGTYSTQGATGCYWASFSSFSGSDTSIIANGLTSGPQTITVAATDVGFESKGCGTWSLQP